MNTALKSKLQCYYCGEDCSGFIIIREEKPFCCEGCEMVYDLLNERGMCEYYQLNKNPGINKPSAARNDKFSFPDNIGMQQKLINFKDGEQVHVSFYLPQIHCSSCLWLLENLHQLNDAVIKSSVNFPTREITVVYAQKESSLREHASGV